MFLTACITNQADLPISNNTLYSLKNTGSLNPRKGVLVISAGRERNPCKECNANWAGNLPFVSYHLMHEYEQGKYRKIAFIPSEAGAFSQIGKKRYGFIHMREMPEGNYVMLGDQSRALFIQGGGMLMMLDHGESETDISYEFSIQAGKINYLGEFVTQNGLPVNSSILISDERVRDLEFAFKKYPQLKSYDVVDVEVKDSIIRINVAH